MANSTLDYRETARVTRAAREAPDSPEHQLSAARHLLEQQLPLQALPFLERASDLAGTPELAALAGSVAVSVGDLPRAVAHFKLQLSRAPEAPEAHANLGLIAASRAQWEEAAAHLRSAVELGGETAEWHNDLGVALYRSGRTEDAVRALKCARRLAPAYRDAALNLADLCEAEGDPTAAFEVLADCLRYQPGDPQLAERKQVLFGSLRAEFRRVWKEPPLHPSVYDQEYFENHLGTEENTRHWQQHRGKKLDPRFHAIAQLARIGGDEEALDLGCGRGELAYHLAGVAKHVVAVDYSEAAVEIARSVCAERSNVEIHCGDAKTIDYSARFALVVLTDVVEHLYPWELEIVLDRCRRALVTGGQLLIHTPVQGEVRIGNGDDLRTHVVPRELFDFPVHVNLMRFEELRSAVERAQFRIDQVRFDGKIILSATAPQAEKPRSRDDAADSAGHAAIDVRTKTLVLFASNDAFLGDLRRHFEGHYQVRMFSGGSRAQMERELAGADLAWFEWCDEFLVAATELPKRCPIVCRLHSYEAFGDLPERVDWSKVDGLIFVNQSVRDLMAERIPASVRTVVIPNGVDFGRYRFPDTKAYGKKVAFAGYLNFKKNPGFLLACFEALHRLDPEFTFHIAGRYQGAHIQVFLEHMLPRLPFQVEFDGWVDDMPGWLADKDYVLSTSYFESFHYAVAEGMACGLLPLVYDWRGSENCYPSSVRFRTLAELSELMQRYRALPDPLGVAAELRSRLARRFDLGRQLRDTQEFISTLLDGRAAAPGAHPAESPADFDVASYWESRLARQFNLAGVGYLSLGETYNRHMYRLRRWRLAKRLSELGLSARGKRVLDLGAGTGYFVEFWSEQLPGRLEALDITETAVARLTEKFPDVTVHKADISAPGLTLPGTFDLISAFDLLFHIVDDEAFARAVDFIARQLAPGGYAVLTVGYTKSTPPQPSTHYHARTEAEYAAAFARAGLELVTAEPLFVTMNAPLDPTRVEDPELRDTYADLWKATEELFGSQELAPRHAELAARMAFLHEQIHLKTGAPSPSAKLVIARKRG